MLGIKHKSHHRGFLLLLQSGTSKHLRDFQTFTFLSNNQLQSFCFYRFTALLLEHACKYSDQAVSCCFIPIFESRLIYTIVSKTVVEGIEFSSASQMFSRHKVSNPLKRWLLNNNNLPLKKDKRESFLCHWIFRGMVSCISGEARGKNVP